jgi:phage recombination protein Bet
MNGTEQSQALEPREGAVRYLPVGAEQEIKLSAKMVQTYLCKPTNKGHVCSERDAQKFVMLCLAKGLNPWENDAWLVGYDSNDGPEFSLITAHQALLKRAEMNPNYDGMESGVIVKSEAGLVERAGDFYDGEADERVVGGWAKVYRKDQAKPTYERLRLASMKKNSPFWRDNPEGQIVKCAEAAALRRAFPTKCGGLFLQSEVEPGTEAAFNRAKPVSSSLSGNGTHSAQDAPHQARDVGATVQASEPRQTTPEASPQEKLKVFVEQEGFNWDVMALWLEGTGNMPEGAGWKSFEEIPDDFAKRFLRAKEGLKKGLQGAKGVVTP